MFQSVNQNFYGSTEKVIHVVLFWPNNKLMVILQFKNYYCNVDLIAFSFFQKFNEYLDELTEHYDIPKVSWTK